MVFKAVPFDSTTMQPELTVTAYRYGDKWVAELRAAGQCYQGFVSETAAEAVQKATAYLVWCFSQRRGRGRPPSGYWRLLRLIQRSLPTRRRLS